MTTAPPASGQVPAPTPAPSPAPTPAPAARARPRVPPAQWGEVVLTLGRTFGARGLALRAVHEIRRATGAFRRAPRSAVGYAPMPRNHPFAVDAAALERATNHAQAVARAERVLAGEYQAYRGPWRPLPEGPAGWLRAPNQIELPAGIPWWRVSELDFFDADIKDVWEPARFGWAYDLVRAWLITRDDRYAAAFHKHFAEWCESSPPFRGVHWNCGQEASIRAIALLYAEANLAGAPSSDQRAMARIASVLAATGERVRDAIGHAVSQRNNHAISEAAGLLSIGARFRGTHPNAVGWSMLGRRLLERLVMEQFAEDGWYIQHSFNYLRLALDMCIIARRVLAASSIGFSHDAAERLRAATRLLLRVMDSSSGVVPNHGHNDGAFVHPITLRGLRDYRPCITAACASFNVLLPRDVAPDNESLAWLGLAEPKPGDPVGDGVWQGESGWAVARAGDTAVFLRAGRYTSRPGHLDPLHVDVRLGGREVLVDAGTFAYKAPPPWDNALAAAHVHNGPLLDDEEPGLRGPRFLWLIWPHAAIIRAAPSPDGAVIVAEIPDRLRRTVHVERDRVRVEDLVLDTGASRVTVRLLLHPAAKTSLVRVAGGARLGSARESDVHGWFSPTYGVKLPSRWIQIEREARAGMKIGFEIDARGEERVASEGAEKG